MYFFIIECENVQQIENSRIFVLNKLTYDRKRFVFFESIFFQVLILVRPIVDCFIFAGDCFLADNFLFSRF